MRKILKCMCLIVMLVGFTFAVTGCAENTGSCESCKRVHPEYFKNEPNSNSNTAK